MREISNLTESFMIVGQFPKSNLGKLGLSVTPPIVAGSTSPSFPLGIPTWVRAVCIFFNSGNNIICRFFSSQRVKSSLCSSKLPNKNKHGFMWGRMGGVRVFHINKVYQLILLIVQ